MMDKADIQKGERMRNTEVKIRCETEGFDEAQEKVEALASAYDGFPPQVQVKNCRDCTINIYPSQMRIKEVTDE